MLFKNRVIALYCEIGRASVCFLLEKGRRPGGLTLEALVGKKVRLALQMAWQQPGTFISLLSFLQVFSLLELHPTASFPFTAVVFSTCLCSFD